VAGALVVAAAPVAGGDVELAVDGAEADPAAVVVGLGLGEAEDLSERARVGEVGVCGIDGELADAGGEGGAGGGDVDVELAEARCADGVVVGVEGQTQEPTLAGGVDGGGEEGSGEDGAGVQVEDPDGAAALRDEEARRVAGGVGDENGVVQAGGHARAALDVTVGEWGGGEERKAE